MPATTTSFFADFRFSDAALVELLRALRARAASHPESPGLIACWPGVREHRMAAACGELNRRGYAVERVLVAGRDPHSRPTAWALVTGDTPQS